jgi:hypothetical protein
LWDGVKSGKDAGKDGWYGHPALEAGKENARSFAPLRMTFVSSIGYVDGNVGCRGSFWFFVEWGFGYICLCLQRCCVLIGS